ncbi:MAG: FAD/NAD(P)-binding protein [Phycisphaerales bacterium]|nr:FAD/NAD(P)-binding protein [Phycisphaerales bacterium]
MQVVAVIGAGFTGILTAAWLLRLPTPQPLRIVLIERLARQAGGVAYGTTCRQHILNVPAGRMSAYTHDPDHFLRWAQLVHPSFKGGSFLPRALYGNYLRDLLEDAVAHAAPGHQLDRITGEVQHIDVPPATGPATIRLSDGRSLEARAVVLAVGNCPPRDPPIADPSFYSRPRYRRDPWHPSIVENLDPAQPIMLIGTGLTMYDIAILLSQAGHAGPIHAISRRGFTPQAHRTSAHAPHGYPRPADIDTWPATALGTFKALRALVRKAAGERVDWREVVTAIRADTPALWQRWDRRSREQFLRHLRAFWETHRHRAAPEAAATIQRLRSSGQLHIHAGRVINIEDTGTAARVTFQPRGAGPVRHIDAQRIINCTGPESDPRLADNPLIRSLVTSGHITADPLALGIQTTPEGLAIDRAGRPVPWLSIVGPFRKGSLWENTAVPELRGETEQLARRLASELAAASG